jgi:uncharacterized protein
MQIGILSDTHLAGPSEAFTRLAAACFAEAAMILHAGDLTDPAILQAFAGKEVHAVHGNMCGPAARQLLPGRKEIRVGRFSIGLIHGLGPGYDFEARLLEVFPTADCIVYGHTHIPVCRRVGKVLYINPGSFSIGSRHGAPATYAILEVGDTLTATIRQAPASRPIL